MSSSGLFPGLVTRCYCSSVHCLGDVGEDGPEYDGFERKDGGEEI